MEEAVRDNLGVLFKGGVGVDVGQVGIQLRTGHGDELIRSGVEDLDFALFQLSLRLGNRLDGAGGGGASGLSRRPAAGRGQRDLF